MDDAALYASSVDVVLYAAKDGALAYGITLLQRRALFDAGYLPLFKAPIDVVTAKIAPFVTIVNGDTYLTEALDRPFDDVDELIAIGKRIEAA